MNRPRSATATRRANSARWAQAALERHPRATTRAEDVVRAARLGRRSSTRWRGSARSGSGSCCTREDVRPRARRADRQPGRADGARPGSKAIYLSRLAGRGRREPRRRRCTRTRASTRPTAFPPSCGGSTTRCSAPTRSSTPRASASRDWLAPIVADAEAGFGGPLNAFELMKAMIEAGAAGVHFEDQLAVREEVRPHGRQGARPDQRSSSARSTAARLAADVLRRADGPRRAHRRPQRQAADERRRRARPAVPHRRAHRRGLLPRQDGLDSRDRPRPRLRARTPTSSGARPRRRTSARRASSPRRSTKSSRASCSPTTARRRSTGRSTSTTRRSPSSSASSARWATSSSSSRWPASTRSTLRCSSWRAATRREGMAAYVRAPAARVRAGGGRLHRDAPPARGRHRLLRRSWPRRSARGQASTLALEGSTESAQFRPH